jgi:hypothetical protein
VFQRARRFIKWRISWLIPAILIEYCPKPYLGPMYQYPQVIPVHCEFSANVIFIGIFQKPHVRLIFIRKLVQDT